MRYNEQLYFASWEVQQQKTPKPACPSTLGMAWWKRNRIEWHRVEWGKVPK
jgi:hypothetical protein